MHKQHVHHVLYVCSRILQGRSECRGLFGLSCQHLSDDKRGNRVRQLPSLPKWGRYQNGWRPDPTDSMCLRRALLPVWRNVLQLPSGRFVPGRKQVCSQLRPNLPRREHYNYRDLGEGNKCRPVSTGRLPCGNSNAKRLARHVQVPSVP